MSNINELIEYYDTYDENERLNRRKVEWLTTIRYFEKYIPEGAKIFDCCAGTGRYSFWLAEHGFNVTAGDLMKKHIDIIKKSDKAALLNSIQICDVTDMSDIDNNSYDVVLCMGAYYHIHDKNLREKAVEECKRILKHGGLLVLAYINRNAVFLNHFKRNPIVAIEADKVINDGRNGIFYASDFGEVNELFTKLNLRKIADISVDGSIYTFEEEINSLNDIQFSKFLEYHYRTCEEDSIKGNSMHGLFFAKKEDI